MRTESCHNPAVLLPLPGCEMLLLTSVSSLPQVSGWTLHQKVCWSQTKCQQYQGNWSLHSCCVHSEQISHFCKTVKFKFLHHCVEKKMLHYFSTAEKKLQKMQLTWPMACLVARLGWWKSSLTSAFDHLSSSHLVG